jgi:hypothetical protein
MPVDRRTEWLARETERITERAQAALTIRRE